MAREMDVYGWMVSIIFSFLRKSILRSTDVILDSSLLLLQLGLPSRIKRPPLGIIKYEGMKRTYALEREFTPLGAEGLQDE